MLVRMAQHMATAMATVQRKEAMLERIVQALWVVQYVMLWSRSPESLQ